ncbi:hypothetical protein [Streptomyces hainanensis]|uniref:Uncharacterized protein n=1 Tax=Streptomyces hainanensis TaxID=402648 RepID=A0A4V2Y3A0_9ACTN|nr:hypothetical protein [Streptomyces hainanensis]TDC75695.1 hypothetical protein E1283_11680 [Streptomyces hainanensis]
MPLLWRQRPSASSAVSLVEPVVAPDDTVALGPAPDDAGSFCWPYPFEIPLGQRLLTCTACGAERDWLLILVEDRVHVRCRCAYQWYEPHLPADWYRAHCGAPEQVHHNPEAANRATGFDGTFAGAYW